MQRRAASAGLVLGGTCPPVPVAPCVTSQVKPGEITFEPATRLELPGNLSVARVPGVRSPRPLPRAADEVIA